MSAIQSGVKPLQLNKQGSWHLSEGRPFMIAGPCSVESEEQMLDIGRALSSYGVDFVRGGLWKPRTRPDSFEGVGINGLPWMQALQKNFGLKVITEVSNARHVEEVLKAGIDAVWIGARTTVNPFTVQEIADALRGTQMPVLIKNPVNPDLNLWIGGIERMYRIGLREIAACHRGFSTYLNSQFRNVPHWEIPLELKRIFPELPVITDVSHITGNAGLIPGISQKALDIGFDGLMLEVHPNPSKALSDAEQQISPAEYLELTRTLKKPKAIIEDRQIETAVSLLRDEIDLNDRRLIEILQNRLKIAGKIGVLKQNSGVTYFQNERYDEVLKKVSAYAEMLNLSADFILALFELIHVESIEKQGE